MRVLEEEEASKLWRRCSEKWVWVSWRQVGWRREPEEEVGFPVFERRLETAVAYGKCCGPRWAKERSWGREGRSWTKDDEDASRLEGCGGLRLGRKEGRRVDVLKL